MAYETEIGINGKPNLFGTNQAGSGPLQSGRVWVGTKFTSTPELAKERPEFSLRAIQEHRKTFFSP
jgi:hypothetical protein